VVALIAVGQPTDAADPDSLGWRHKRLHRTVLRNPARLLPLFTAVRDAVEARWIDDPPDPAAAFAEGDQLLREWTDRLVAVRSTDSRPFRACRYWRLRNRWARLAD